MAPVVRSPCTNETAYERLIKTTSIQSKEGICLGTANGVIEVTDVDDLQVGPSGEVWSPYVLESTPDALAI